MPVTATAERRLDRRPDFCEFVARCAKRSVILLRLWLVDEEISIVSRQASLGLSLVKPIKDGDNYPCYMSTERMGVEARATRRVL